MIKLPMLSDDDRLAEIRRLYFRTSRETIQQDFTKALDLLRAMAGDDQRERAAVFMEGLAEMRSDWAPRRKKGGRGGKGRKGG
jgi:hypothetical protein